MKADRKPSCHIAYPSVASEVGFVYICPGRYEEKAGYPCAGQTGTMLEALLPLLVAKAPVVFGSTERTHYLITNAWPIVEFKRKTGRSVPLKSDVLSHQNVERLYQEIRSLRYVVACGNLAQRAIESCQHAFSLPAEVANATHTSRRALGCPSNENLPRRLNEWAESVAMQFSQFDYPK